MIRKLMASTAVLALMSTGAFTIAQAQTEPAEPVIVQDEATTAPATTELAASEATLTLDQPTLATVFIGRPVYSSEDPESDSIGDVNDLIVSEDGTITHAVVGVGGFLGIGEKDVAVPFDELQVVEKDGDIRLIYASTREQLEAAPALDRTAFDPMAQYAEEQAAAVDTGAGSLAPAPAEPSQDMAAAPAEEPAAPAEEETAAAAPEEAAPAEDEVAATTEEEPATASASSEVSFVTASADQVQASDLMGKSVYGAENESIGEISDLILEKEGKTRVAVIDVGGFLGVGEKTVGIPFDQLQIAKAEDGSELVTVAMSKADLEQLPAIEIETAAASDATSPALPAEGEQPADQMATAPAEPAVTTETPAETAQAPATDEMTTGSIGQPVEYTLATQDIAASKLIGAVVYGADNSNLGEVSDLIFTKAGDIEAAVIDVGGFLGMGEKPIALQFGALNVRTDENGAVTVMVSATQEQLDQAPTFEEPEQAAVQ